MSNIAIFASGTGSNFLAINKEIEQGNLDCKISVFITDRPNCKALESARELGIESFSFRPKDYESKSEFEKEIVQLLNENEVDLVVLAGYMRIIGETLLNEYAGKIINIHPSYLPMFKGKDAIGQALESDVDYTGVTVHYVDEGMDTGEIIKQVKVVIDKNETRETLENKVHAVEHKLYSDVIKSILGDK